MKDGDEEYERFDVDNDFEGGQWIGGEYFYKNKRQKRQQTEDDRLYGIFAEDDSEDEGRGRRGRRGGGPGRSDFTKPVNFVSKGRVDPSMDDVEEEEEEEEKVNGEMKQEALQEGEFKLGLGYQTFDPAAKEGPGGEEDDGEDDVLPTMFGRRIKEAAAQREKADRAERHRERQQKEYSQANPSFGSFEKFTKGIGAKLLGKMGYTPGKGLGKDGAGIVKPIEPKLRPKKMGMGYGDFREQGLGFTKKEEEKAEPVVKPQKQAEPKLWKRKNQENRQKRVYKTAGELLNEQADNAVVEATPIIDMRGPQARVVTNLEHLQVQDTEEGGEPTPLPELQHNLQLLVDMSEAEIRRVDSRLRQKEDTAVMLGRDQARLEEEVRLRKERAVRLASVLEGLEKVQQLDGVVALNAVEKGYRELKENYMEEYELYNVAAVALVQVLQWFKLLFRGWDPFADARRGLMECQTWRSLLQTDAQREAIFEVKTEYLGPGSGLLGGRCWLQTFLENQADCCLTHSQDVHGSVDPYTALITEVILPSLRSTVTNRWEPRDPEPMVRLVEAWEAVWPRVVLAHVLEGLVMPKLRATVAGWEPREERIAIHVWLHPWLVYLGEEMAELYPTIMSKLANALQSWHPSDGSALALLGPWKSVFDSKGWEGLLVRCILPKLVSALQELVINPLAQELAPFQWVMQWQDALPLNSMAGLLEAHFFPKWLQVLHHWLLNRPDYDEVSRWYIGWRDLIPEALRDNERVSAQLSIALNLMHTAADGLAVPPLEPDHMAPPYFAGYTNQPPPPPPPPPPPAAPPVGWAPQGDGGQFTLRDLVQRFAEESNVEFVPKAGRLHEGLQVYGFGTLSVVLESSQNSIRAQLNAQWVPVSLDRLLSEHRAREARSRP
eukprot:evm.model.scf_54.2 EVM.evm.TU.scf_54.2   scf_54:5179-15799(+)